MFLENEFVRQIKRNEPNFSPLRFNFKHEKNAAPIHKYHDLIKNAGCVIKTNLKFQLVRLHIFWSGDQKLFVLNCHSIPM